MIVSALVVGTVLVWALVLWFIYIYRSARAAFGGGCVLLALGLVVSLLLPSAVPVPLTAAAIQYLGNAGIMVASVGANLIASAVLVGIRR